MNDDTREYQAAALARRLRHIADQARTCATVLDALADATSRVPCRQYPTYSRIAADAHRAQQYVDVADDMLSVWEFAADADVGQAIATMRIVASLAGGPA